MGLRDTVTFDDAVAEYFSDIEAPTDGNWKTKSLGNAGCVEYHVDADGRLLKREVEQEIVPREERPLYDEEEGGFESEWEELYGMLDEQHKGWTDTNYHGVFRIYRKDSPDLEVKFTDGELTEIRHYNESPINL